MPDWSPLVKSTVAGKYYDTEQQFLWVILSCESRLMHGRLRIAVAELFLFREIQPESCRPRFARERCDEEILLAFVQGGGFALVAPAAG